MGPRRRASGQEAIAPDFVGHWPAGDVLGIEALMDVVRQTRGMFDTVSFVLEIGPLVDEPFVAARWTGVGSGADATSRFVGHDLLRVERGQVAEYWPSTVTVSSA